MTRHNQTNWRICPECGARILNAPCQHCVLAERWDAQWQADFPPDVIAARAAEARAMTLAAEGRKKNKPKKGGQYGLADKHAVEPNLRTCRTRMSASDWIRLRRSMEN